MQADSHLAIPVDRRSLKAILAEDAAPYGWLSASLQAVMPAHVIYPKVDKRPAGFSARWLQDVLRHRLGFTGAIFSDDLSMAAARQIDGQRRELHRPPPWPRLQAGCDMVLLCNQSVVDGGAPIDEAIDALSKAMCCKGDWQPNPASEERRLALLPQGKPALDWDAVDGQRALHARAVAAARLTRPRKRGRLSSLAQPQLGGRSSRSDTSSSRSSGLSSAIRRCLSSGGAGSSSAQRLATQPLSSHW